MKRLLLIFSFVLFELILNFQNYHAVTVRILRFFFLLILEFFLVFNFVMIDYNLFTYSRENIFILFYKPLFGDINLNFNITYVRGNYVWAELQGREPIYLLVLYF